MCLIFQDALAKQVSKVNTGQLISTSLSVGMEQHNSHITDFYRIPYLKLLKNLLKHSNFG
jgi:hypothetical protein